MRLDRTNYDRLALLENWRFFDDEAEAHRERQRALEADELRRQRLYQYHYPPD